MGVVKNKDMAYVAEKNGGMTLKQKAWVKEVVATRNLTEATRRVYNVKNVDVAKAMGSENFAKPYMNQAVTQELERAGITLPFIMQEHESVIKQNEHIPAKNTAIDMAYKLYGTYAPDRSVNVNLNIPTDERGLQEAIDKLIGELKES